MKKDLATGRRYADVFGVWPAFRDQKVIGGSP